MYRLLSIHHFYKEKYMSNTASNLKIEGVKKRSGEIQKFDVEKIVTAISKAMFSVDHGNSEDARNVALHVVENIKIRFVKDGQSGTNLCPSVEEIQDIVEETLMTSQFHDVAKSYILYRQEHANLRRRDIFKKRTNLKPYEYPELYEYVKAIRHSYWIHTEFNYTSDIQDFKVNVNDKERSAMKNAMLAIAQIEVAVKTFWGAIYNKLPKPEVGAVGFTFAESEVRHMDAYAHLLEILGLNLEFTKIKEIPALINRVRYLEKSIKNSKSDDNKEYAGSILLFSLFIEHVSLFSQFLIMMSFNKHRNLFKGISNAVEATSKEEQIHGMFGIDLINIIKKEHPEWFDNACKELIIKSCQEAYEAECGIVDWIYEDGELEFMPATNVKEFIKNRFNNSLAAIGLPRIFEVSEALLEETDWFDNEVIATKHVDFFHKRSINYNKRSASVTSDDLF